jgi:hypothetical protein
MITEAYDPGIQADIFHLPTSATSKPRPVRIHEAYEIRSKRSIGSWREFLPEDCVAAMIKMGWDRTT